MAFFLIVFTLSSIGLPGLNGFVGEFLVLLGTATSAATLDRLPPGPLGFGYAVPAATGIILGAVYMLWMCQRVLFGPLTEPPHTPDTSRGLSFDLTRPEISILAPIAVLCVVLGVWPKPMLAEIESSVLANILAPSEEMGGMSSMASAKTMPIADALRDHGSVPRRSHVVFVGRSMDRYPGATIVYKDGYEPTRSRLHWDCACPFCREPNEWPTNLLYDSFALMRGMGLNGRR